MSRKFLLAAGQMGPIAKDETKASVVKRLIELMREAHSLGCRLIVFPELTLTTFFPRWYIEDESELDQWFETSMPNKETQPLFDEAKKLGIGFYLGYAELVIENGKKRRFNTSILVGSSGEIIGKYRKIHLPGYDHVRPWRELQYVEKMYFECGNYGFPVWEAFGSTVGMCLCNDRRWAEVYRVMALQGAEMILLGYNTHTDPGEDENINGLTEFHNHLSMQAGAYQNSVWVVGTARSGQEEGSDFIGQSAIIAPSGQIVAQAMTREDELVIAPCDLNMVEQYRRTFFDFDRHREPQYYKLIAERKGFGPAMPKEYFQSD